MRRGCDVEERAAETQSLIHCRRLPYEQLSGLLQGLSSGASRLRGLLKAVEHLSHRGERLLGQLSIELCLGFEGFLQKIQLLLHRSEHRLPKLGWI